MTVSTGGSGIAAISTGSGGAIVVNGGATLVQLSGSSPNFANDAAVGTASVSGGVVQSAGASASALAVHYDAASSSYSLSTGGATETFSSADLSPSSVSGHAIYDKSDGATLDLYTTEQQPGPKHNTPRQYVAMGFWQEGPINDGTATFEAFTFGIPTLASAAPRTGAANYDVDMVGRLSAPGQAVKSVNGAGVFEADFLTGQFKADISPVVTDLVSASGLSGDGIELIAQGTLSTSNASFSGTSAFEDDAGTHSTYYVGSVSGQLYGPAGQEVGAVITGANANGGKLVGAFFGAQTGTAPSENLTLTNIYTQQLLRGLQMDLTPYFETNQIWVQPGGTVQFVPGSSSNPAATFTPADIATPVLPNFTTYQKSVGGAPVEYDLYNVGPGNTELALTYSDLAMWRQGTSIWPSDQARTLYAVYGLPTNPGVVAGMSGSAQYAGVVYGGAYNYSGQTQFNITGTSAFAVDFGSQTLTGSMVLTGVLVGGSNRQAMGNFSFSGSLATGLNLGGSASFNLVDVSNGQGEGQLNTVFYGPKAEELGGVFQARLPDNTIVAGATVAKRR